MFALRKVLFGTSQELDEEATDLLTPTDLGAVLERHRAGRDPVLSSDQEVVLFHEGTSPVREHISIKRDSESSDSVLS